MLGLIRKALILGAVGLASLLASTAMAVPNLPGTHVPDYLTIDLVDRSALYTPPGQTAPGGTYIPPGTPLALGQEQFDVALLRSVEFGDNVIPPPLIPPTQSGIVIPQPANQQITAVVYDLVITQIVQTDLGLDGIANTLDAGESYNLAFGAGGRQPLGGGTLTDLAGDLAPAGSGGVIAAFYDDIVAGTNAAPPGKAIGYQGAKPALGLSPIVTDGSMTMIEAYPDSTDGTLLMSGVFVPVTASDIDTFYGVGSGITPVSAGGAATVFMEKITLAPSAVPGAVAVNGNFRGWVNFLGGWITTTGLGPQYGLYNLGGRTGSDMAVEGQVNSTTLGGIPTDGLPWALSSTDPVGFAMAIPEPMSMITSVLALGALARYRRRSA